MLTLTYLYEITGKETYRRFMEEWVQWMMDETGLLRAGDVSMITGDPNDEILIDTLFMAVFFPARAGKILGAGELVREADYQILNHIRFLLNRETGLFYNGWNFGGNHNYGKVLWGAGTVVYHGDHGISGADGHRGSAAALFLSVFGCQARALKVSGFRDRAVAYRDWTTRTLIWKRFWPAPRSLPGL